MEEKRLLSVKETCTYLGIKQTLCRQLLRKPDCPFVVRLGDRLLVDKKALDIWLDNETYLGRLY